MSLLHCFDLIFRNYLAVINAAVIKLNVFGGGRVPRQTLHINKHILNILLGYDSSMMVS